MGYSPQERQKMANLCNEVFQELSFKHLVGTVSKDDFDDHATYSLIHWATKNDTINGANKLIPIFSELATSRISDTGQFYHFKPSVDRVRQIIQSKEIELSALYYLGQSDYAEYSEFFKRTGFFGMFYKNKVDDRKKKIFILCFTKNARENRFWSDYSDNDNGACIVFRFEFLNGPYRHLFDLRDVYYDAGYEFEFINDLRYKFVRYFGKELFLEGINKFAQFYKRGKYKWENETRLSFDYDFDDAALLKLDYFPIQQGTDKNGNVREYIKLKLNNHFFNLNIEEIICGHKVTEAQKQDIKNDLANPNIKVWRRP